MLVWCCIDMRPGWPQVTLIQNADVSADDRQRASRPTVFKVIDGDYHPGRCAFRCFTSTATYTYAGMFNGTQCFCESTVQGISQSSSVGKPCLGAPDFQCGNNGLISIYQLKTRKSTLADLCVQWLLVALCARLLHRKYTGTCGGSRVGGGGGGGVLLPRTWTKYAMNSNFMTSLIH